MELRLLVLNWHVFAGLTDLVYFNRPNCSINFFHVYLPLSPYRNDRHGGLFLQMTLRAQYTFGNEATASGNTFILLFLGDSAVLRIIYLNLRLTMTRITESNQIKQFSLKVEGRTRLRKFIINYYITVTRIILVNMLHVHFLASHKSKHEVPLSPLALDLDGVIDIVKALYSPIIIKKTTKLIGRVYKKSIACSYFHLFPSS